MNGSLSALSFLLAQLIYNNVLAHFTAGGESLFFPGAPFLISATIALTAVIALLMLPKRGPATS
jgi:DHA1 family tetracycline resistance protein-like MFS transporter